MTDAPIPVVDQQAFDRIECNRCGECCESFSLSMDNIEDGLAAWHPGGTLHDGPLGMIEAYARDPVGFDPAGHIRADSRLDPMMWFGQLEVERWGSDDDDGWHYRPRYRCGHFTRDADGLGVCGVYDQRPWMCSAFPYGRPVDGEFTKCAWLVIVIDYDVVQGEWLITA